MSDLLPNNATEAEHALDDATARIGDVPVPIRDVWNPQACPPALLPWLAWAFSVDDWQSDWTEDQKRAAISAAIVVQQKKGTIGAVRTAMATLGINATVQEWFAQSPQADPYTYRLQLETDQGSASQSDLSKLLQVVDTNKSLRSHLSELQVSARSQAEVYTVSASGVGHEITNAGYQNPVAFPNSNIISVG